MKPTVRFFRHDGICRPMNVLLNHLGRSTAPRPGSTQVYCKDAPEVPRPTHRRDEYRPVIPQRVARQHCPPPLHRLAHPKTVPGSGTMNFQRTVNSVLTVCLSPGDHPNLVLPRGEYSAQFMSWQAVVPSLALIPVSLIAGASPAYRVLACIASGVYVYYSGRLALERSNLAAKRLLMVSIIYAPLAFCLIMFDKV
jgi:hypothetical protein